MMVKELSALLTTFPPDAKVGMWRYRGTGHVFVFQEIDEAKLDETVNVVGVVTSPTQLTVPVGGSSV